MPRVSCIVFTRTLTFIELKCLDALLHGGNTVFLYTFYPLVTRIPDVVRIQDARMFLAMDWLSYPIEMIENLFSYKVILEEGGWFVSMSRVVVSLLGSQRDHVFCEQNAIVDDNWIGDFLLRGDKDSELFDYLYHQASDILMNQRISRISATGTELLTGYLKKNPSYRKYVVPSKFIRRIDTKELPCVPYNSCVHVAREDNLCMMFLWLQEIEVPLEESDSDWDEGLP